MSETSETPSRGSDYARQAFALANVVLRYRWIVLALPILAGALSLFTTMSRQRSYTSKATFMTQSGPRPAASGLAAQFGVNLGGSADPTLSPEFYADLISTRPVLAGTVRASYTLPFRDSVSRQTLVQYYADETRAIDIVRGGISTALTPRTGVVSLSVRSVSPAMAQQLAAEILRQLDGFNKQRRKSRVSAEREFTEARMADAATQLRAVEDSMQQFYTRNRDFDKSPELKFREERMLREVVRRQQLYATLAQAFEQAKIDEVRDTPVITVLEEPTMPRIGDSRNTLDRALLASVIATLLAVGLAFLLHSLKRTKLETVDGFTELKTHGREFWRELRHPIAAVRRLFS